MKCRAVAVGAILASGLGLVACSSSGGDPSPSSPVANPPTSVASRQSVVPTVRSTTSVHPRDLKSQLLSVAEVPVGWAVDNSSDKSDDSDTPPCFKHVKSTLHTSDRAEVRFVKGTDLPTLQQSLGYFGSSAAGTYQAGAAVINSCKDISFTNGGHRISGSIGALSFPKLGQQSSAWQFVLSTEGVTFGIDVVLVQKGSELTELIYADIGTPDIDEATLLARKAVAKMPAT
jgi:hypothetical protein